MSETNLPNPSIKGQDLLAQLTREEMPDLEHIRQNCHNHAAQTAKTTQSPTSNIKRVLPPITVFVMILALSTTALAVGGGYEWLLQRINPAFAQVLEPVMAYTEDQGIRVTLVAAQRFDGMAMAYFSVQDTTGTIPFESDILYENPITDEADDWYQVFDDTTMFMLRFGTIENLWTNFSLTGEAGPSEGGFNIITGEMLYFNETTNTGYYRLEFSIVGGAAHSDMIVLSSTNIAGIIGDWRIEAPVGDVANVITLTDVQTETSHFDTITLTPFGLRASGRLMSPVDDADMADRSRSLGDVYVETTEEKILLAASGSAATVVGCILHFEYTRRATSPLDVQSASAIYIDGVRIPLP